MQTKKSFLPAALIISGLMCVNAIKAGVSDNVTLNLKFHPVQSITVNPSQKIVDIEYVNADDYANGKSSGVLADHLTVFSTGGFVVSVKTDGDFQRASGGSITAADVTVKAENGTGTAIGTFTDVALSTTANTLITADDGGKSLMYNITYDNVSGGSNNYINKYVHPDDPVSVYTAQVTYTIVTN
ncbi:MAG: hypothetical protein ACYC2P_00190 [Paludibacteraceae bacterium]